MEFPDTYEAVEEAKSSVIRTVFPFILLALTLNQVIHGSCSARQQECFDGVVVYIRVRRRH